jgi:hypothetical protein
MKWKTIMSHLQLCLKFGTLQVLECHRCESNFELLHDLHHEQANNAKILCTKCQYLVINCGGNFIVVYWILECLQCFIHV